MSRRLRVAAAMAALLLLASVSGASAAADGTARPWAGYAVGQTWFDVENPKGCEAGITTRVDEPAVASHFGAGRIVTAHCPTGDFADNFAASELTLVAANGDAVFGTYVGTIDQYTEVEGERMTFTLQLTITGGDGRFEGATGSAVMAGYAVFEGYDDYSWAWALSWEGTLSY